jgi:hypothetical protein
MKHSTTQRGVDRRAAPTPAAWVARDPALRRGQTYLWQVTATLRGGSSVVASGLPSPEALLRIIPSKLADELAQFRQGHEEAHLVLDALYAQAGMLTESADAQRRTQIESPIACASAVPYASDDRSRPHELGRQFADPLSSNGLCQEIVEPCEHAHDPFGG